MVGLVFLICFRRVTIHTLAVIYATEQIFQNQALILLQWIVSLEAHGLLMDLHHVKVGVEVQSNLPGDRSMSMEEILTVFVMKL